MIRLTVAVESWPIDGTFTISRGAKTEAAVVVVTASDGAFSGQGECVPYPRYDETVASVVAQIETAPCISDREELRQRMPAGAARNAIDCALWHLEAQRRGETARHMAGLPEPLFPLPTCYTLSLASPDEMARTARAASGLPLLKMKLGGAGDAARMRAIRAARPDARLVADANEAWTAALLPELMAVAAETGIELIEQPLPAGGDGVLVSRPRTVPVCADESVHTTADLARLAGLYDAVNIKLDKAGGLTEALDMARAARAQGFRIMAGCMVATSLSMAPALLLSAYADWLDLDGPLLLGRDRTPSLAYGRGCILAAAPDLWG